MTRRFDPRFQIVVSAALALLLTWAAPVLAQEANQKGFELTLKAAASRLHGFARTPDELADVRIIFASVEQDPVCGFFSPLTHYSFLVRVGPGEHDVIRLHRAVREGQARNIFRPQPSIFLVHGDLWGFEGAFLSSAHSGQVPCDQSIAAYLANQGVDVWGIDLRWATVPAGTPDPIFMKEWGTDTHVHDIGVGAAVARAVRSAEGRGRDKMNLLGWSSGAFNVYAFANDETRFPEGRRHTKGLIPVDIAFEFSPQDEALRRAACQGATVAQAAFDRGQVYNTGQISQDLGRLALTDPNGAAPFPGLTNRAFALFVGASTYAFGSAVPFYHFTGGIFNEAGTPTGLSYTRPEYLFYFYQLAAPYQSTKGSVEGQQLRCGETDLPWDDHLKEVVVPVLYVGAGGGYGDYGVYSTTLLGSRDVTTHVVSRAPRAVDFGHVDLFLADDARAEVWSVIYHWLLAH